jgi:hypothetical protein
MMLSAIIVYALFEHEFLINFPCSLWWQEEEDERERALVSSSCGEIQHLVSSTIELCMHEAVFVASVGGFQVFFLSSNLLPLSLVANNNNNHPFFTAISHSYTHKFFIILSVSLSKSHSTSTS